MSAINGDRIAASGDLSGARGRQEIDATGLAVAPGFINMLSHSATSLIADGRSQSDIRQGVTLEVMGEGSMGPLNDAMKSEQTSGRATSSTTSTGPRSASISTPGEARRLANVASFVGAATVRVHEIGLANRPPTAEELERMRGLVRRAMEEGALGVASSLIYAPALSRRPTSWSSWQRSRPSTAACTSRTCAARATGCSKRSTS